MQSARSEESTSATCIDLIGVISLTAREGGIVRKCKPTDVMAKHNRFLPKRISRCANDGESGSMSLENGVQKYDTLNYNILLVATDNNIAKSRESVNKFEVISQYQWILYHLKRNT